MSKKEVAVFGGSFNPPHVAHVMAASWVLSATRVESVMVVPTFQHPFGKAMAPYADRVAMAEAAFHDLARVSVSRIEEELGGDSFTVRTLEALEKRLPEVQLRLVVGADVMGESARWHAFDRICAIAPLIVLGRGGHALENAPAITLPELSSTEVRRRLRAGESVDGLVPTEVIDYIHTRHLYRTSEEGA